MIKDLLKEGFALKSQGYYKHAIEAFYKALEIDNSSPELMLEIAELYYLMEEEERALSYIEEILSKNPTHINSLELLKKIFLSKHAWSQAEQTVQNIYSITHSTKHLAQILELLNKQERFADIFKYRIEETTPEILYEFAYAKLFLNQAEEAENFINKALESIPNNKNFLLLKGKILFKLNRCEECSELLNLLDKSSPDALNFIGLVKQWEMNYPTAIKFFLEAIKLNPVSAEYNYNCASTYFKSGEIKLAKKYYNLAISLDSENPAYHFALANLYYSQHQYKRAMEELKSELFEAKLLKAVILYDSGYLALSKKEFNELDKQDSENPLIKDYLNKIEEKLGAN